MSFVKIPYMLIGIALCVLFTLYKYRYDRVFFEKVRKYWFFERSLMSKLSNILLILFFFTLSIAVGDLRGKEVIVEASVPLQKTVVLIDSSASMLVEDVRPNRIRKAGVVARHFVRNSFGHQVSLSVFSDIQKKIVPFTDDIDILESRLETLMTGTPKGSSNVSLALQEAVQYFRTKDGFSNGNILLITDGEEHSSLDLELPKEINVAIVGLGSEKGGKIPLRRRDGSFLRYKRFQGQEVVSKLNKSFFESLLEKTSNGKIWYVQSYGLPTNEILSFFNTAHKQAFTKGSFRQRPVAGYFLIKVAIIIFILSVLTSRFKTFIPIVMLLILFSPVRAQENIEEKKKTENPEVTYLMDKFKNGEITQREKLRLAEIFSKRKGDEKKSLKLYQSTIKDIDKASTEDLFNFGTTLLKNGGFKDGIELYKYLDSNRDMPEEMKEIVKKHIQLAFQQKKQNKGGKSKDKKDQKDQKDQNKNDQNNKKQKSGKQKDQKQKKPDDKDSKSDKKKSDKKQDEKDKNKKKDDKKNKKKDKKKWEDVKKAVEKKKRTSTVKGVLKQIMNDDSNLQRKFIDTTSDNNNTVKDW